jgi:hypothetical protein
VVDGGGREYAGKLEFVVQQEVLGLVDHAQSYICSMIRVDGNERGGPKKVIEGKNQNFNLNVLLSPAFFLPNW